MYALVLAPAVWILCGVGFDQDLTGRARDNGGLESLSGVLLLVLAGAAYAILLLSPISPLGPLLAGLVFAAVGAWARIAPSAYAGRWPGNVASDGFDLSTPGYGLAVLLAVPLLATALSARRWRAFEPPEIVLLGTIGRVRGAAPVAGTTMASEQTTVIPQQRREPEFVPGFDGVAAETAYAQPTVTLPADDGDEKTTVMQLGRPAAREPEPVTEARGPDTDRTVDVAIDEEATRDVSAEQPTQDVTASAATQDVTASMPTQDVTASAVTQDVAHAAASGADVDRTGEVTGDETTRLVLPATAVAGSADETEALTLPTAESGEKTQVIRPGTVQPPGERTQLLTFPAPAEPETVTIPHPTPGDDTGKPSIVVAERPDPGEDPTTRLTLPTPKPAGPATGPARQRGATTVSSLERPADEAADDTRPITLPAPRPPADDEPARRR